MTIQEIKDMTIVELSSIIIRNEKNIVFPLDNHSGRIYDSAGTHLLEVRGWGHFQYAENEQGGAIQDSFGDWVVATLNAAYRKEKVGNHT